MGNIFSWTKKDVVQYRQLGKGAFGSVYLVNYLFYLRKYAVKVVDLPDRQTKERSLKEVAALRKVGNHRNVIEIFSAEVSTDGALLIWMEYCDLGDLEGYMRNNLSIDTIISLMKQLCDAVNYIHSKGVIHRDIKPQNILLKKSFGAVPQVKLADFGIGNFAETISYFEQIYFSTQCGTPSFMAPEVMQKGRYHNSADIYSMGVVIRVLIQRCGNSNRKAALQGLENDMTKREPSRRPSGSDIKTRLCAI